jgi:aconitate hydratase
VLPLRSNIPEISKFVFATLCPDFYKKAEAAGGGVIVGGTNYGQGSSREHAAIAPMYLGIRAVIAKSFARIHKANLINYGILPFVFVNLGDYDAIAEDDILEFKDMHRFLSGGMGGGIAGKEIAVSYKYGTITLKLEADERDLEILIAGGTIPWIRKTQG